MTECISKEVETYRKERVGNYTLKAYVWELSTGWISNGYIDYINKEALPETRSEIPMPSETPYPTREDAGEAMMKKMQEMISSKKQS